LVPDLDAAVDMDVSGSGFSVGGPGNIEIADLAELLEGGFNWKVEVDSPIEDDTVAQGSWSGTLEEALQDYAIDQGIEVTIDDDETTITFSRL
jgi:hypothetical protein